jgi:arylsulfatase A-like enzyme
VNTAETPHGSTWDRLSRRGFLSATAGLGLAPMAAAWSRVAVAAPRPVNGPPNIVAILTDDQGWGDLSLHGNINLSTPHIDSIARDGALFERFFVCAVCAPTRAEFLTGRYYPRTGVRGVTRGAERINLDEKTIGDTFKAAGYATGAFGKWHNGSQHPYHPNARGFDEFYGFTSGHWGHYFAPEMEHNGRLVQGNGYIVDDLTDHALRFIRENRNQPFFCYVPYNTPHSPMQVPDRFFDGFAGIDLEMRNRNPELEDLAMTRAALAMCENIDWNVGRVLAALDELGVSDNTIVLYFSDNGPNSWRWNGGMKGRKGSIDEGGLRVPFLIRWPARIQAGKRVSEVGGAIDLLPTLAEMAGIEVASPTPLDGVSLCPLLYGAGIGWPDRLIFSIQRDRVSVRSRRYRLDAEGRLFDMDADPGQDRDIVEERPVVAARLKHAADEWRDEMLPFMGEDDRPFPVGYAGTTMLPARDGVPQGGIQHSSRHPNCSFFTNWTSGEDAMSWDIEVGQAGNYEAEIHYTCRPEDVGSTVELRFFESRVRAQIDQAHDPPLVGAGEDRVLRSESYVKEFRPLRLGLIRLQKGRGELKLRALEIAGSQVADIRYVLLLRKD